jgi:signal peptidase II
MNSSRAIRLAAIFLVLVFTAGCDQATKQLARSQLGQSGTTILPGGFIELGLAENPGAFLSLGASLPAVLRQGLLTVGVAVGLALVLFRLLGVAEMRKRYFLGWLLVWAGGMSNLYDRLAHHGLVTDFIMVHAGPFHTGIFNLADMAIMAGLAVLVLAKGSQLFGSNRPTRSGDA